MSGVRPVEANAGLFDCMVALGDAEREAASDLATARRDGGVGAAGFEASAGARYVTIPDVEVGFYVVRNRAREDVGRPGHLADKLRRREG